MPTPASKRNYKREAEMESPARQQARRDRKNARYAYEKKHGDMPADMHVDHKRPISQGGSNDASNLRAIPKKQNESFDRAGPGGKQIGAAGKKRR